MLKITKMGGKSGGSGWIQGPILFLLRKSSQIQGPDCFPPGKIQLDLRLGMGLFFLLKEVSWIQSLDSFSGWEFQRM